MYEYKYLGVTLTWNLSWSTHIDNIVNKTRKLTGMPYRQFYQWSEPLALYLSLIRPHLEYEAPVWDSCLFKEIQRIEAAQKFALRVCLKDWNSPCDNLLMESGLSKLSVHRSHLSLCHLYRIVQEQCVHPNAPLSLYHNNYYRRSQDSNRYGRLQARTNVFSSSLFPRTIRVWNSHLLKLLPLSNILL